MTSDTDKLQDCCKDGHDYQFTGKVYFKLMTGNSISGIGGLCEQAVSYTTLYCRRCGATKEIVATDSRSAK